MKNQKLTLKAFMQALAEAAAYADYALRHDYAAKIHEPENINKTPERRPLCVANMHITFTANVSENKNTSDLYLDFDNPNGNFKGKIIFNQCASGAGEGIMVQDDDKN